MWWLQTTDVRSTVVGITCIAKPNPPKKYEITNKGKGGAGAWMIHETIWETCPGPGGLYNDFSQSAVSYRKRPAVQIENLCGRGKRLTSRQK